MVLRADTPPTCRHAYVHTHTAHPPMQCEHTHISCITHALVHTQMTPNLPTPSHPWAHSGGQPASLLPPVPSPRPGGFSVPLPGRHMWFQLAAERAFPSQTSGPCQALAPQAPTRGATLAPTPPLAIPAAPEAPLPRKTLLSSSMVSTSPGAGSAPSLLGTAVPRLQPRLPACLLTQLCLEQAERDGRRAGCQGGGREGGEGACGNETLITEPLLFPSIWDISYILKTLAVYIFKGSG